MGVSVDTLCRSEALHSRLHYQSVGLPMDVVEVDTVHSKPFERLLARLANVLPRPGNLHGLPLEKNLSPHPPTSVSRTPKTSR